MLRDEPLVPEEVRTALFGTGKLQKNIKRHAGCCVCQYYASKSGPCAAKFETAGWRLHASELGTVTKLCEHVA